ncbi:MAG: pur operon repressor [Bacillota bacterium]
MKDRWPRPTRIACIVDALVNHPYQVFNLGDFARDLKVARSTISEDVAMIREAFARTESGVIETLPGASGGVRLKPRPSPQQMRSITETLLEQLQDPDRILPGGFLYMTDIIFSPRWAAVIGTYFSHLFGSLRPDYVVTIETKGIPLALMTARDLDRPLVLIRRNSRVTEGSSVSINYVSGSSSRIQTMSLPRRALPPGSSVVVIDDFMRGGGTVKGVCDLLAEFEAEVLGIGVVAVTTSPRSKLVEEYESLAEVTFSPDGRNVQVRCLAHPD